MNKLQQFVELQKATNFYVRANGENIITSVSAFIREDGSLVVQTDIPLDVLPEFVNWLQNLLKETE